ncbi:TPA: GNAT family N-acetyltransferase, partial [Listeria monocytogenes]|nr:GNAT family N-acetyltransferase [Listeria monocytogenes]
FQFLGTKNGFHLYQKKLPQK